MRSHVAERQAYEIGVTGGKTSHTMIETTNYERTILLIGDSFGALKPIALALQDRGHSIIWGKTGKIGLRLAEYERPNLVVCETELTDISGMQVCRLIKGSAFFETPVALVGRRGEERFEQPPAFWAGADVYFADCTDRQLAVAKLEALIQRIPSMKTRVLAKTAEQSAIDSFMESFRPQQIIFE